MKPVRLCMVLLLLLALGVQGANLSYSFDEAPGGVVANLGDWGSAYNGTLTDRGTLEDQADLDGAAFGFPGLMVKMNKVLHSVTNVGTATGGINGVSFYTPEGGTDLDYTLSFWLRPVTVNGSDYIGNAGGQQSLYTVGEPQTHVYTSPDGAPVNQTWYVAPGGGWGSPRWTGMTTGEWHFYTLTFTSSWTGSYTRIYKDGVWVAQQPGNPSRGSLLDGFGIRVGGHNGASNVYIDNLMWQTGLMLDVTEAEALFASQFVAEIPEPGTVALGALASVVLWRRRRH